MKNLRMSVVIVLMVFVVAGVVCSPRTFAMSKFCPDVDGDSYPASIVKLCPVQVLDCNDNDRNVNPGASEVCYDGIDNNCNGQIDEGCIPKFDAPVKMFFKGPYNKQNPDEVAFVANSYDAYTFVEAGNTTVRTILDANKRGTKPPILFYTKAGGVHGPETRPVTGQSHWQPFVDAGLRWTGSLGGFIRNTQYGWYYANLNTKANLDKWEPILENQIRESNSAGLYNGIFLDNAVEVLTEYMSEPAIPGEYDPKLYYQKMIHVVAYLETKFPTFTIIPNGYIGSLPEGERGMEFVSSSYDKFGGICFEGASYKVGGKYFEPNRYKQHLIDGSDSAQHSANVVWMDYFDAFDTEKRMLSFATYLLINNGNILWYPAPSKIPTVAIIPETKYGFGKAVGNYAEIANSVFVRNYENAVVVVNYSSDSYTFHSDTGFVRVQGAPLLPFPAANAYTVQAVSTHDYIIPSHNALLLVRP